MNTNTLWFVRVLLLFIFFISCSSSITYGAKTIERGESATINWNVAGAPNCTAASTYTGDPSDINNWDSSTKSAVSSETFTSVKTPGTFVFSCDFAGPPIVSDSDTLTVTDCGAGKTWSPGLGICVYSDCLGGVPKTWGTSCTGNTTFKHDTETDTITNTTSGYEGTATFACNLGTWASSPNPGWTCNATPFSCTGTDPANATVCTGDTSGLTADTAKSVVSSCTSTKCEYTCNPGTYFSGGTCVNCPPGSYCPGGAGGATSCPADTYCPGGNTPPGGSLPPTSCPPGWTAPPGSTSAGACTAPPGSDCPSQVVSWSAGNCSGTISPTSNGATNSVTNGNAGYTGNAIFSCSAGSYSYVSGSCTASAGAVHGVCGSTHYNCTSGTMAADWTNGSGYYSWSCLGSGGGSDASCSEDSTSDYPVCGGPHYTCSRGTSSDNAFSGFNYTWKCNYNGHVTSCSEWTGPDASIGAPTCYIGNGSNSCTTNVTWTTNGYPTTYEVYRGSGFLFSTTSITGTKAASITYSTTPHKFSIVAPGVGELDSVNTYAKCDINNGVVRDTPSNKCVLASLSDSSCTIFVGGRTCVASGSYFAGYDYGITTGIGSFDITGGGYYPGPAGAYTYTYDAAVSGLGTTPITLSVSGLAPGTVDPWWATSKIIATGYVSASCEPGSVWDPNIIIGYDMWGDPIYSGGSDTCKTTATGPDLVGNMGGPAGSVGFGVAYSISAGARNIGKDFAPPSDYLPVIVQIAAGPDGSGGVGDYPGSIYTRVDIDDDSDGIPDRTINPPWTSGKTLWTTVNVGFSGSIGSTMSYRVCVDKASAADVTGTIAEFNEDNNCTAPWQNVTVITPGDDIAAGPVVPSSSVSTSTYTTYTSLLSNLGTTHLWFFPTVFEVANGADGSGTKTRVSPTGFGTAYPGYAYLAPGSSYDAQLYRNFPTAGTWSLRACADRDLAWGQVYPSEIDETNNCSAWTNIDVTDGVVTSGMPNLYSYNLIDVVGPSGASLALGGDILATGENISAPGFSYFFYVNDKPDNLGIDYILPFQSHGATTKGDTVAASDAYTFPTPGFWSYTLCADMKNKSDAGIVDESNEADNCDTRNFVISGTAGIDLTASSIHKAINGPIATSTEVGVSTDLWVLIANIGTNATGRTFRNLFQVATAPGGGGTVTDIAIPLMANLAAGDIIWGNTSYIFSAAGTYSVRACADKTSAGDLAGVVGESDENNNCGGWTDIVVTSGGSCSPGQYWNGFACVPCTAGNYCEGPTPPIPCPPNTYCDGGNTPPGIPPKPPTPCPPATPFSPPGSTGVDQCVATTGTISAFPASCTVPTGGTTCTTNLTWTTVDPVGISAVTRNLPSGTVFTGNNGTSQPTSVSAEYPNVTYYLYNSAVELASTTVTATCAAGPGKWDTINAECADPQVSSATVVHDYGIGGPSSIDFTCLNSDSYSLFRELTPFSSGVYAGAKSIGVSFGGNYQLICKHGSVQSATTTLYFHAPPPPGPKVSVDAYPKTIKSGAESTLTWIVQYPVPACVLTASPVCTGGSCTPAQLAATAALNTIINASSTDLDDPSGSRRITTAVKTIAPGHETTDYKALGKKTFKFINTTDLTVNCGVGKTATTRVRVTNVIEQ